MQCVDLGGRRIIKKPASVGQCAAACAAAAVGQPPAARGEFFQAEDGIRDVERSRGLGDVYKRQVVTLRRPTP